MGKSGNGFKWIAFLSNHLSGFTKGIQAGSNLASGTFNFHNLKR
jgi:hypothetical protein